MSRTLRTRTVRVSTLLALILLGIWVHFRCHESYTDGDSIPGLQGDTAGRLISAELVESDKNVPDNSSVRKTVSVKPAFGRLPITFEENRGQVDPQVRYLARRPGYTLFLTDHEAVVSLRSRARTRRGKEEGLSLKQDTRTAVVRIRLCGDTREPSMHGEGAIQTRSNYFIGNDPSKWRTGVPHYRKVVFRGAYAGIDWVFRDNGGKLEYDFVVAPGADPYSIELGFQVSEEDGAGQGLRQDADGRLVLSTRAGDVFQHAPVAYQILDGKRRTVPVRFDLKSDRRVGFQVAAYDRSQPLIIDPTVEYASFIGGTSGEFLVGTAIDGSDDAYLVGFTTSTDFPIVGSPFDSTSNGNRDCFVAKVNPQGDALVYTTYVGGDNADEAYHIDVDGSGNAYACGQTQSNNFPLSAELDGSFDDAYEGFVFKLGPNGSSLVYSTYLGGDGSSESLGGIAVDAAGAAYVTGVTNGTTYPTTSGSFQETTPVPMGSQKAVVSKIEPDGSALAYSTFLAGTTHGQNGVGIDVDSAGNAYVIGSVTAADFPTVSPIQATNAGDFDAFVAKLNPAGSALVYSTYLGGTAADMGVEVLANGAGEAHVLIQTQSSDMPTQNPHQATLNGGFEIYVAKLSADGSALTWGSFLGGSGNDFAGRDGLALDGSGNVLIVGGTGSADFPTVNPMQATLSGTQNALLAAMDSTGTLTYASFLGASGTEVGDSVQVNTAGDVYVGGWGGDPGVSTTGGFQPAEAGGTDGFIVKFSDVTSGGGGGGSADLIADLVANPQDGTAPLSVTFDGSGSVDGTGGTIVSYDWDFGNGTSATTGSASTTYTYATEGIYVATLAVRNSSGLTSDRDSAPIVVGDGITSDKDVYASRANFGLNHKSHDKGKAADSFSISGYLNPAGVGTDFSGASVRLLVNDQEVGPTTGVRSARRRAAPRVKGFSFIPLIKSNGAYTFKVTGADLRPVLGIRNETATENVRFEVKAEVTGVALDTPTVRGVIETAVKKTEDKAAKGKFSAIKLPILTGFFKSLRTVAKKGKSGGYIVQATGPAQGELALPLLPTGPIMITIGSTGGSGGEVITVPLASLVTKGAGAKSTVSYSAKQGAVAELKKFQLSNAKKKFVLVSTELAGTGIPDLGTGSVAHDLEITIDVPTATGLQQLTTTVEIKRANDQSKSWKR